MINGHGDDIYQYDNIRMNFSSNICHHAGLETLKAHLSAHLDLIANYPEPEAWSLEKIIAQEEGVSEKCVVVTNGATEAIYLLAQTFRYHFQLPAPSFSEYKDALSMYPQQSPLTGLWLCNPNNPTGEVLSMADIDELAKKYHLVVIDQSYEDYTDAPMLSVREAIEMGNVIQLHSLTKSYGIPGLRIGYITASAQLTEEIRKFLRPWSVNALAIEAGKFLLTNGVNLKPDLNEAQRLVQMLRSTGYVNVRETKTNFMLCEIQSCTAAELKERLAKDYGILIRDASNFEGLTPHHFRVASQAPNENDELVAAIKSIVEEQVWK